MTDRWQMYGCAPARVADGFMFEVVAGPSRLAGSNGMTIGPDGRLYVTQVFLSQVTAIDVETGEHELFSPLGGGIVGPDDAIFGADGTFYATEPLIGRVSARNPDGTYRVVRDNLPGANGITMDHAGRRLFVDEFRPGGRLMELDPSGDGEPDILLEDLNGPNALSMGPDGRLYFPQVFANEIWVYDLTSRKGELLIDGLNVPTAVKFDSRGRIVTSEAGAGRITAIDIATGERETLCEVPKGIDNVSVGAGDRLFVSHYVNGRVAEETAGRHRILAEPGLLGPYGLALSSGRGLLIADALNVSTVSADGAIAPVLTLLIELHTLAVGVCEVGDDLFVLAASGEVLLYSSGSSEPTVFADGLDGPTSIVADRDAVLVTERAAGRLTRVGLDGRSEVVHDGLTAPGAVARDERGNIFVSQGASSPVLMLAADGSRRSFDGFAGAQGLAVSGGALLVADPERRELVVIDVESGARQVAVSDAPIGPPAPGVVAAAFTSVCADGSRGFYVGCNGDGSVRHLTAAPV
jgi:sugar lactone lactonase YvrE